MNKFPYYGIYHLFSGGFVLVKFMRNNQDSQDFIFGEVVCSTNKNITGTGLFAKYLFKPIDKKLLPYYKKQAIFYKL